MAKIKIKEGSVRIELEDDAKQPNTWIVEFPGAVFTNAPLHVKRYRKHPQGHHIPGHEATIPGGDAKQPYRHALEADPVVMDSYALDAPDERE